jgi:uncharacterized RDD family membrane protein YckC
VDSPSTLPAGTRLAHYEIRRALGEGAVGTVYEAYDTALDRAVAIKVVHAHVAAEQEEAERFALEPRTAARVVHDNLTHVYFVGTTEGRPFYAMELVRGGTLEAILAREGALALERAIDVLTQAARGLAAAHAAGLVHRDVKPANLLLTEDGRVKVTDFGLAKSMKGDSGSTQLGSIVGTPDYMSPEQCRGTDVDPRTDVYALGLTAYTALTGEKPWKGATIGAVLDEQMHGTLPSVVARRPELPSSVDEVLALLTSKDVARRPPSMRDAARLLEGLRPRRVEPAPLAARGAALAIDLVLYAAAVAAVVAGARGLAALVGVPALAAWVADPVAAVLFVVMQLGMERWYGGSVGKLLLHLEVVREDGGKPATSALVRRLLVRIPAIPFFFVPDMLLPQVVQRGLGLLVLAVLLAGAVSHAITGRTLSDRWTRTRVAYRRRAPDTP